MMMTPKSIVLSATVIATLVCGYAFVQVSHGQESAAKRVLMDFNSEGEPAWVAVNDGVMGGVSEGRVARRDGRMQFTGDVSLENNGGFASTRTRGRQYDLSAYEGFVVRLRGDGKKYDFTVRTDLFIPGGYYRFGFETRAGEWQDVRMPFDTFRATSFGRDVAGAPAMNTGDIRSVGFIISDKQTGEFALEVEEIAVYGGASGSGADTRDEAQRALAILELAIERGVPLFNDGQPGACAAVYEVAARSLLDLTDGAISERGRALLRTALRGLERTDAPTERAWILRRALDQVWLELDPPQPEVDGEKIA